MRQEEIVLRHLQETGTITSTEAQELYRVLDLPKRISVLRQEGNPISRKPWRDNRGKRTARYFMEGEKGADSATR